MNQKRVHSCSITVALKPVSIRPCQLSMWFALNLSDVHIRPQVLENLMERAQLPKCPFQQPASFACASMLRKHVPACNSSARWKKHLRNFPGPQLKKVRSDLWECWTARGFSQARCVRGGRFNFGRAKCEFSRQGSLGKDLRPLHHLGHAESSS